MEIIQIDRSNIDEEHICCAIGNDKQNQTRANTKKEWLKDRFDEGLVFKRFNERGKLFIEYMPIEKCWKPIVGKNYMVINCLWVAGQYKSKGLAKKLIDECIEDSIKLRMNGIVVVSSDKVKPFLTDKKFYINQGFEVVDVAYPYFELLVLKFNKDAPVPFFTENAKSGKCDNKEGITFIYSNQCPFMEEYIDLLAGLCEKRKIKSNKIKLESFEKAQMYGSPFGTLGIYFNGEFKTHELMPEKKFEKFLDDLN